MVASSRGVFSISARLEFDVGEAELVAVLVGEGDHVGGHVYSYDPTPGPDLLGGKEAVDAAAASEVDYGLALIEGGEGGRVSAPGRGLDGLGGEGVHFFPRYRGLFSQQAVAPQQASAWGSSVVALPGQAPVGAL